MKRKPWRAAEKAAAILLMYALGSGSGETLRVTLHQAVLASLEKNPALRKQIYDVAASEQDITTAALRPNPQILLNGDMVSAGLPGDQSGPLLQPDNKMYGASLSFPFETAGKRSKRITNAKRGLAVSKESLEESKRQTAMIVANAWFDVFQARLTLELNLKAKSLLDSLVAVNRTRLRNQVITSTDLTRSIVTARQYETQVEEAQLQVSRSERALALLLGMGISDSVDVDMQDTLDAPPPNADSALAAAVERRSDVRLANAALQAASTNFQLQKAQAMPDLSINADFSDQQAIPFYGLSLGMSLPLFSRNQGEIAKANIAKQQAELNLASQKKSAEFEIISAFEECRVRERQRDLSRANLEESETVLRTVEYSYRSGNTTILDFMDAQRTWYDTRQSYDDMWISLRRSYLRLSSSLGLSL